MIRAINNVALSIEAGMLTVLLAPSVPVNFKDMLRAFDMLH